MNHSILTTIMIIGTVWSLSGMMLMLITETNNIFAQRWLNKLGKRILTKKDFLTRIIVWIITPGVFVWALILAICDAIRNIYLWWKNLDDF